MRVRLDEAGDARRRGRDPDAERDERDARRRAPSRSPWGASFSTRITTATTAIQNRLITPSANRASIRPQQQPTQNAPCSTPIRKAPSAALAPAVEQEVERRAAVAQADVLERRQLVDAGGDQRPAGDVPPGPLPGEPVGSGRDDRAVDAVGDEPVGGPGGEVARDEDPRRHELRLAAPRALARDLREQQHHRRRRRQHHRRHHRHPDADVPAEPAEVGARARRPSRASAAP